MDIKSVSPGMDEPQATHRYGRERPCSTCQHFGHWIGGQAAVWCLHGKVAHSMPLWGCAYWAARPDDQFQRSAPNPS